MSKVAKVPPRYLAKYGAGLIDGGYEIIPIARGSKIPPKGFDNWQKIRSTPKLLKEWLDAGHGACGIGILTRKTPALDLDVWDADVLRQMVDFVELQVGGKLLERRGAKGTLYLGKIDTPFAKVQSDRFTQPDGKVSKVEILGDGQQFVALHIHPDTKQPYRWVDKLGPHNTPAADLPTITQDDAKAIVAEFNRIVTGLGWQRTSTLKRLEGKAGGKTDLDDPFAADTQVVNVGTDELRTKLMLVPGAADYDTWLQIGMALFHQYEGDDTGLELWHEWSAEADNYDSDTLNNKWATFDIGEKGRAPVTARLILKLAKVEEKKIATESFAQARTDIQAAQTVEMLRDACEEIKKIQFDTIQRETIIALVKKRFNSITGSNMTVGTAREMVRYESQANRELPWWLEGWIYVKLDGTFHSMKTGESLKKEVFNDVNCRFLLTRTDLLEGKSFPDQLPSHVALNLHQIPRVWNRMYMPGEDEIFTADGVDYVNTYNDKYLPELPAKFTPADLANIEIVKGHFDHLFANERDRRLLLDWMAYIVQTRDRVNWAPLIQGTESDGKTMFYHIMSTVLGFNNTRLIAGESLTEKYNAWAEGSLLVFVEEVRLTGKDRYAVLNKLKPNITNTAIPVRRMNTDTYSVVNRSSYMMVTNYKDGIPAGVDDTRYFPMFSRFQSRADIVAFNKANPHYYTRLIAAIEQSAGALRKWLLEHELSSEFHPKQRAPESSNRREMVYLNTSDERETFDEILAMSSDTDVSPALLNSEKLRDLMIEHGGEVPYGKAMKQFLSNAGYTYLGRFKVDGSNPRFWSRKPSLFILPNEDSDLHSRQIGERIRAWIANTI